MIFKRRFAHFLVNRHEDSSYYVFKNIDLTRSSSDFTNIFKPPQYLECIFSRNEQIKM